MKPEKLQSLTEVDNPGFLGRQGKAALLKPVG
jgi:hypothetical protein